MGLRACTYAWRPGGVCISFVPGPWNLVASPVDTTFLGSDWNWNGGYYYKVSAFDIHGNESEYALLRPEDITGEDVPPGGILFCLSRNYPNPFNWYQSFHL